MPDRSTHWRRLAGGMLVLLGVTSALFVLSRSRTVQLFGEVVARVETSQKVVALTFDDGPTSAALPEILSVLERRGIPATFFVVGRDVEAHPESARALVAAGHELGNHSYSHVRMILKSPSFLAREFASTDALIRQAGYEGVIHVRAPYCKKLVGLPWYFARHQRIHVTFDVEPESDPKIDADPQAIVRHVLERARPGSIILLHPWYRGRENARAALPGIVEGLQARGYEFVTVSRLLAMREDV